MKAKTTAITAPISAEVEPPESFQVDDESSANCRIACCGPEPMMEAVSAIAKQRSVPCEVSLETPMACGIGICFTCVAKVTQEDGNWDFQRTCIEGPVFDSQRIVW